MCLSLRKSASGAGLCAVVLALLAAFGCGGPRACPSRVAGWGVPVDLCRHLGQLESLTLPAGVEDVDWLRHSSSLRTLELPASRIQSLGRLPPNLEHLVLGGSRLDALPPLPAGLVELDLSWTRVGRWRSDVLPASLTTLVVTDVEPEALVALPPGVVSLSARFEKRELEGLPALPSGLRILALTGHVHGLDGLPDGIEELTLDLHHLDGRSIALAVDPQQGEGGEGGDGRRDGRGDGAQPGAASSGYAWRLPASLRLLNVQGPAVEDLLVPPADLEELHLDSTTFDRPLNDLVPFLLSLGLRGVNRPPPEEMPRFLETLALDEAAVSSLAGLPETIRDLRVAQAQAIPDLVEALPEDLRSLALVGYPVPPLQALRGLRELDLTWSRVGALDPLPRDLERLVLSYASLETPPELSTLSSLRTLEWRGFPLAQLPELPSSLRHLDLEGAPGLVRLGTGTLPRELETLSLAFSAVEALPADLPPTLRELDLRGTAIRSLQNLPPKLEVLRVSAGQLDDLRGLPPSVRSLEIEDALATNG